MEKIQKLHFEAARIQLNQSDVLFMHLINLK